MVVSCEDVERLGCVFCGEDMETTKHLLECLVSKIIWSNLPWALNISFFAINPLSEWLRMIIDPSLVPSLPREDHHYFQLYALNVWGIIWWTQNQMVHQGATLEMGKLLSMIHGRCGERLHAWAQKEELPCNIRWSPPLPGTVKMNFDVAIREEFAMGAAVIRDHCGKISGACVKETQVNDPLEGEVFAAHLGFEARRCGFKSVILEGDSLHTIEAFRKYPVRTNWSTFGRIDDILSRASEFDSVGFSFVKLFLSIFLSCFGFMLELIPLVVFSLCFE